MKSTFKDLLKEPLLHFMIVGLILFLAFEFAAQEEVINEDDREGIIAYSFKRQRQEAARNLASNDEDDDY